MAPALRVLVVCTGNISRSPVAAALLADQLPGGQVTSAGTRAVVGSGADPAMLAVVPQHLHRPHRARQLTASMLADQDLVLGLARAHRAAAVGAAPRVLRRAFTLRELARLVGAAPDALARAAGPDLPLTDGTAHARAGLLAALLPAAALLRSPDPAGPQGDDVDDPYGLRPADYREAWGRIAESVERLVTALDSWPYRSGQA